MALLHHCALPFTGETANGRDALFWLGFTTSHCLIIHNALSIIPQTSSQDLQKIFVPLKEQNLKQSYQKYAQPAILY